VIHLVPVSGPATYSATFAEGLSDTLTFNPTDDATIRADRPDRLIGLDPAIEVDASPVKETLLRFDVEGLAGRDVATATLRLYVTNSSPDGGTIRTSTNSSWDESTVTWNNAPPADGPVVGDLGDVNSGGWAEVDVTAAVTGDGPLTLRASSGSTRSSFTDNIITPDRLSQLPHRLMTCFNFNCEKSSSIQPWRIRSRCSSSTPI